MWSLMNDDACNIEQMLACSMWIVDGQKIFFDRTTTKTKGAGALSHKNDPKGFKKGDPHSKTSLKSRQKK
jgi:hypothetical protein